MNPSGPNRAFRFVISFLCLLPTAYSLLFSAAFAEEKRRVILINPFINLRTDWNSNTQGAGDPGNLAFRTLLGSTLRFDFPGGLGFLGHYQSQLLVTRDQRQNGSIHTGTLLFSYQALLTGFIDMIMPFGGAQVQYRVPTGLAGTSRLDNAFFAGVSMQHAPTRESVLYWGAQFDYFAPSDTTQANYGPSILAGYRQILGTTALVGVTDRLQVRMTNANSRPERWRNDLTFDLYYFPWPWLMLNPTAGLQYNSTGDFLTWMTGISVSTNLWFVRATPPAEGSRGPAAAIEYRNDLRQIQLDTSISPPGLGLPGDVSQ